jgi:hypothetical protein
MTDVQGRCPACGGSSLMLADGGYITCRRLDCPQPDAASEVIADFWQARQHGAFTFCAQLVGHVTMTEFAKKITEKREAIGQRAEAVRYANGQQQRAERAEAALARLRTRVQDAADEARGSMRDWLVDALADLDDPRTPAPDGGPTVAEAATDDKRWPLQKGGE